MFIFNPEIKKLDIEVEDIVALYRSANDMQVAVPGHGSQRSSGFLCCYKSNEKYQAAVIFLLQEENTFGFYTWEEESFPAEELESVVEEGLGFFEAMGFMMSDLELGSFSVEQSRAQWHSFPLKKGLERRSQRKWRDNQSDPDDSLSLEAFQAFSGKKPGEELREETPYEKCQLQRLELCKKVGRLLASF